MATERVDSPYSQPYWFDPTTWSGGFVPQPGDTAQIFGNVQVLNGGSGFSSPPYPEPVGAIAGVNINLSAVDAGTDIDEYGVGANLTSGPIGTVDQPVNIEVTDDSGQTADASIVTSGITGSLTVDKGQALTIGGEGGLTILGTTIVRGTLRESSVLNGAHTRNDPVSFDGRTIVDGGSLFLATTAVNGVVEIENDGSVTIGNYPFFGQGIQTVQFDGPNGGTFYSELDSQQTTIRGFGTGDTVLLGNLYDTFGRATYQNNVLSIYDYHNNVGQSLRFEGDYTLANLAISTGAYGGAYQVTYVPTSAYSSIAGRWQINGRSTITRFLHSPAFPSPIRMPGRRSRPYP